MRRQPYTSCKLYADGFPDLQVGDFITTEAGSAYLVQTMRVGRSNPGRKHLECLRWPIAEIPADAKRHVLYWYSRGKRRST